MGNGEEENLHRQLLLGEQPLLSVVLKRLQSLTPGTPLLLQKVECEIPTNFYLVFPLFCCILFCFVLFCFILLHFVCLFVSEENEERKKKKTFSRGREEFSLSA